MSERFFISPNEIDIDDQTPLIMLEGPVQGSPDWQTPLAMKLLEARDDIAVASPRATEEHELAMKLEIVGASERQVAWEYLARNIAMDLGGIALWWNARDYSLDYPEGRVYGKTSNIELGEIWGWKRANPNFAFAMGYSEDFLASKQNSRSYIQKNHSLMEFPILESLDEVADSILKQMPRGLTRSTPSSASQSIQRALDQLRSR